MTCPNYITPIIAAERTVIADTHKRGDISCNPIFSALIVEISIKHNRIKILIGARMFII